MRKFHCIIAGLAIAFAPQAARAGDHSGDPHWIMSFDSKCWLYNPFPDSNESVAWNGRCDANGDATGEGKTTWFKFSDWKIVETGSMYGGMMFGWWERRPVQGNVEHSYWEAGKKLAIQGADPAPSYGNGQYRPPASNGPTLGDRAMETLERQRRENCAAVAEGRNRGGCYGQ